MDQSVKVVNGELICLRVNHNCPVKMIVMDDQVPINDRLLCYKCFESKRQVSRYISLEEAQGLIDEKLQKQNQQQEQQKKEILNNLNDFQNKMMNIKSRLIQKIDEILSISQLWITDISNIGRKSDINNFIEDLQLLQQDNDQNQIMKSNQSHLKKICLCIKKLTTIQEYQNCQKILKNILIMITQNKQQKIKIIKQQNQNVNQSIGFQNQNLKEEVKVQFIGTVKQNEHSGGRIKISELSNQNTIQSIEVLNQNLKQEGNVKNVQVISTVKQNEISEAIAFNYTGSIMVAGCDNDIKVWSFEQGKMIEKKRLNGHTNNVSCLVFSKKHNWFASGSMDKTIRCWKEDDKKDWVSTQPRRSHSKCVLCLILNNQEDQLISCSIDMAIKVWKVNCQVNQLEYDYTLDRHIFTVFCISLNESETALVSCGGDKKIILWSKEQNTRWIYKHELIMDDKGYRICFISENQIIWQQRSQGITHLLELNQGKLRKRSDLNFNLNKENGDNDFFPTIRNKRRQVIIQKHNHYVYILKQQSNGQLAIVSEPIDCKGMGISGHLTEDGEYLTIWDQGTEEFRVINIQYE